MRGTWLQQNYFMDYGLITALSGGVWQNHIAVMETLPPCLARDYMLKSLYDQLFKVLLLSLLECARGITLDYICLSAHKAW